MHNLKANFDKILNIIKQHSSELVNEQGNIPRSGTVPRFSDLEVVALSLTAEALEIDSENLLFAKLHCEYLQDFPLLISRRQYNDRRKNLFELTDQLRQCLVTEMEGKENVFSVDSKPVPVCKLVRKYRSTLGKTNPGCAPDVGYCASMEQYYYGYKLHALCSPTGVIHSFDLSKASVHDIHYLKDLSYELSDCVLVGDKAYLSKTIQVDLFTSANIRLEVPVRQNQQGIHVLPRVLRKVRKRVETSFSQLDGQFNLNRNYAKNVNGLFIRTLSKVTALTILQYINKFVNNKPIGQVKYALAA